tara:strand:+ start:646 stop:1122 length:477 start_codon:yes stop_codon:yes gene_type:complete
MPSRATTRTPILLPGWRSANNRLFGDDIDYGATNPPDAMKLDMSMVRELMRNPRQGVWVVEDETLHIYRLSKTDPDHSDMLDAREGPTGQFHTGKSGLAGVGDGGDHGIHFWLVGEDLRAYLASRESYLRRLLPGARHEPTWHDYTRATPQPRACSIL